MPTPDMASTTVSSSRFPSVANLPVIPLPLSIGNPLPKTFFIHIVCGSICNSLKPLSLQKLIEVILDNVWIASFDTLLVELATKLETR